MDAKQTEIAEKIKNILVENLRIPAEELDYEIELFGDGIGLDSIDSLEIIAGIDQEFGVQMTGVPSASTLWSIWRTKVLLPMAVYSEYFYVLIRYRYAGGIYAARNQEVDNGRQ